MPSFTPGERNVGVGFYLQAHHENSLPHPQGQAQRTVPFWAVRPDGRVLCLTTERVFQNVLIPVSSGWRKAVLLQRPWLGFVVLVCFGGLELARPTVRKTNRSQARIFKYGLLRRTYCHLAEFSSGRLLIDNKSWVSQLGTSIRASDQFKANG